MNLCDMVVREVTLHVWRECGLPTLCVVAWLYHGWKLHRVMTLVMGVMSHCMYVESADSWLFLWAHGFTMARNCTESWLLWWVWCYIAWMETAWSHDSLWHCVESHFIAWIMTARSHDFVWSPLGFGWRQNGFLTLCEVCNVTWYCNMVTLHCMDGNSSDSGLFVMCIVWSRIAMYGDCTDFTVCDVWHSGESHYTLRIAAEQCHESLWYSRVLREVTL
jgi:hypothetical protein